jgi:hypothetical protein
LQEVTVRKQITHVSPMQTAKVVASFHFVMSWVLVLVLLLRHAIWLYSPYNPMATYDVHRMRYGFHGPFLILLPFVYAICSFILVLFAASVYNLIAARLGGVEYTATDMPGTANSG